MREGVLPAHHLALDIGASSGRLILPRLENGLFALKEENRFPNGISRKKERAARDCGILYVAILKGLKLTSQTSE